jgi:hypothetical protein
MKEDLVGRTCNTIDLKFLENLMKDKNKNFQGLIAKAQNTRAQVMMWVNLKTINVKGLNCSKQLECKNLSTILRFRTKNME